VKRSSRSRDAARQRLGASDARPGASSVDLASGRGGEARATAADDVYGADEVAAERLVVFGASWGGLHALSAIVRELPADLPAAVAIVQHRSKDSGGLLAELLREETRLPVVEVEDKEPIRRGRIYVAPPDYHLLVDDGVFSLSVDAAVRYSRPSIDVTMASAADAYGERTLAVVLTGANDDGARGARYVVDRGGQALVQDPASAEVRTMPEAAARALDGATLGRWWVVPLVEVAARVAGLVTGTAGARRVP